ncbi:ATP-binding protein [Noviherbaspirillum massiliense]|uniref:ATP-binding protein n=1 Tax=Noviherbaspirillum massiliense TaxID=1465823 RepID=UPI0004750322|nr:ATP-binding protein [Noviherbaspirillum massiliense]
MRLPFQSMASRVFLALVAGVLLATAISLGLAMNERQRMIGEFREYHAIERVAQFILSLENVPADLRPAYLMAASGVGMRAEMSGSDEAVPQARSRLAEMLDQRLPEGYEVQSLVADPAQCPVPPRRNMRPRSPEFRPECEALSVALRDGAHLRLYVLAQRPPPMRLPPDLLYYGIVFLVIIGLLAWLVSRMTTQPLKKLADAAIQLGNDIDRPPLPERGVREIRQAAAAFNAMQMRLRHQIQQQTQILAAITHDLQTPLTRLRLRLEKVDDGELREKLLADMGAMQAMVKEGLDLARSMHSAEQPKRLNLDSLVDSVCADAADAGQAVSLSGKAGASLMARPIALRRCLTNLIDNASKYGGHAEVHVGLEDSWAVIRIRDRGPGIPEAEMDKVFEPFYRLESSRSRQTGGTGLGLTIARNIAEQHGGTIRLANLAAGGLEVRLALPVGDEKQGR